MAPLHVFSLPDSADLIWDQTLGQIEKHVNSQNKAALLQKKGRTRRRGQSDREEITPGHQEDMWRWGRFILAGIG